MRRWLVLAAFVSVGSGSALLFANPAGATTGSYSDPMPCSPTVDSGVCISQVSADYSSTTISLSVTVGQATDPTTDPGWTAGTANVTWYIAVDGASTPSFSATALDPATGHFIGGVESSPGGGGGPVVCDENSGVEVSFDLSSDTYDLSLPSSCIGAPSSMSIYVGYSYSSLLVFSPVDSSGDPTLCCSATPDTVSSTTTTTNLGTTTTTSTTSASTTTSTAPTTTTSTTEAVVTAASSGSTSSGTLAFTGPGRGLRWTALAGAILILLGASVMLIADVPRQAWRRVAHATTGHRVRPMARTLKASEWAVRAPGSAGRHLATGTLAVGHRVVGGARWLLGR